MSINDKTDDGFKEEEEYVDDGRIDVYDTPKHIWNGEKTDPNDDKNYRRMDHRGMDDFQEKRQREVDASRIAAARGSRFPNFVDALGDCLTDHVEIPNEEIVSMRDLVCSFLGCAITYQIPLNYPIDGSFVVACLRYTNQLRIRATVLPQVDGTLKFLIVNEHIGMEFVVSFDSLENISFDYFGWSSNAEISEVMTQGTTAWKFNQCADKILCVAENLDFEVCPEACSYLDRQCTVLVYVYRHKYRSGVRLVGIRRGRQHKCCVVRLCEDTMKNVDFVVGLGVGNARDGFEKVMLGEFAHLDALQGVDVEYTVINEHDFIRVYDWQETKRVLQDDLDQMV